MEKLVKKIDAVVSGKSFYLILGIILLVALVFRTVYLSADPPMGITKSQDFSTDPFQYVYFAKNSVEQGVSNPYHDPRFSQWEKSTQNLMAWGVFSIAGTGREQGNLVGVIFNLLSILLLALAIKNFGSRLGALIFAMLAACDFTLTWFARTPFLEASQNFWLCGALYLFSRGKESQLSYLGSGLVCAAAAFFGKMIALFMLGPFTIAWVLLYLNDQEARKQVLNSAVRFYIGFGVTTILWFLTIYLPSQGQLSGYLSEQAVGLYGAPKAFDSLNDFFLQFLTLLWEHEFFAKMTLIAILTFISGAGILLWFVRKGAAKKLFADFNVGWVLLFLWFAVGYLSLFPWNYRPLRYQTTLMFPAIGLAALALSFCFEHFRSRVQTAAKGKPHDAGQRLRLPWLISLWAVWLAPLLTLLLLWFGSSSTTNSMEQSIRTGSIKFALFTLIGGGLIALVYRAMKFSRQLVKAGVVVSLTLLLGFVVWNTIEFVSWSHVRQYSLMTADRDLKAILNKDAVISGPYGPALTQENKFGSLIHMFGVKKADKELFDKYPVTHLVMDEGNEKRAREDYPDMMSKAKFVTRYFIRGIPVKLYRISDDSHNLEAVKYQPTDYERAQTFSVQNNSDSAQFYMEKYLGAGIPNYTANAFAGDALYSAAKYADALTYYHKAEEFAPGDPITSLRIGNAYLYLIGQSNNPAYADSALIYLKFAQPLFPQDKSLADQVAQLERRKK